MCEVEDERHSIEHREKRRMERETDEQQKKTFLPICHSLRNMQRLVDVMSDSRRNVRCRAQNSFN